MEHMHGRRLCIQDHSLWANSALEQTRVSLLAAQRQGRYADDGLGVPLVTWLCSPLETERLSLRPLADGDEVSIAVLFSDPEVRQYLGGPLSREQAERRAQVVSQGSTDRFWGVFALCEARSTAVIGMASFDDQRGRWQLSYEVLPAWWGQGLALEAVSALLPWFWAQRPEVGELIAVTQTANARSCRLLERLGGRRGREFEEFGATQCEYVFEREIGSFGVTA